MSVLKIAQAIEQENIERAELKLMLSEISSQLKAIKSQNIIKLDSPDRLLTINEVCELTGFKRTFMSNEVREGRLKKYIHTQAKDILARSARYKLSDVNKWIDEYMVAEK